MSDYRSAFNAMAKDIGAIIALLGFDKYPGVGPVLRAITDLVLAKAEAQQFQGERDVALSAVAQLHSMLGVTDQVQAGERIGFLVGQSIMVPKLEAKLAALEKQEPVHWRAMLDPNEIPQQLNHHMHIAGFVTQRAAEDWITERRDFDGWHYTLQPLYAAPVAQAGQVPEALNLLQALIMGTTGRWILSQLDDGQGTELEDGKNWLAARKLVRSAPAQGGE